MKVAIPIWALPLAIGLSAPWLIAFTFGPTPANLQAVASWIGFGVLLLFQAFRGKRLIGSDHSFLIATAWVLAAVASVLIGIVQYAGASGGFDLWVSPARLGEAYGNLRQRNQFASLISIGLVALCSLSWLRQSSLPSSTNDILRRNLVFDGVAVLLGIGIAISSSRTGLVQLLLLIAISFVWDRNWQSTDRHASHTSRRVLAVATAAYCCAAVIGPWVLYGDIFAGGILARFDEQSPTCSSRLTLWSNVLHLIAQKPWLGWGWGELDYAHFITLYPGERFCDILDNAHNLPLHLAVELGVPFALAFCGVCAWLVLRAKPWHEVDPTRQMAWAVLALIGLHSMLEYPLWYGPFQLAVALSVFLLVRTPTALRTSARTPLAAAAAIVMSLSAYVGWDYWRISQIYLVPAERAAAYRDDTLTKIQGSILFKNQVRFAELGTTQLTPDNAQHIFELATGLLHFSPEPSVVKKVIEGAVMLGRDAEAAYYLQRFKAAFPAEHAAWIKAPP